MAMKSVNNPSGAVYALEDDLISIGGRFFLSKGDRLEVINLVWSKIHEYQHERFEHPPKCRRKQKIEKSRSNLAWDSMAKPKPNFASAKSINIRVWNHRNHASKLFIII